MQMLPGFYGIGHIKLLCMIPSVAMECLAHSNWVRQICQSYHGESVRQLLNIPTRKIIGVYKLELPVKMLKI